ncbi:aromatic amino acid lyase, partial [Tropicimonas sp.]|uniref:aromatic amino acid lyase n=1 Tax=Tropicimonas sp. TaxID=2067044 RepID=UPI003A86AC30
MTITLTPGATGLAELKTVWRQGAAVRLDPAAQAPVARAAALVRAAAKGAVAVYGVNTGFGKLASVKIPPDQTETLQRNLILSHCCGVGKALDAPTTRLMMVLKLLSLGRGASGVRWEICALIEAMLAAGVVPEIPVQGSVGASGDLAPLAHLAAVMIG